MQLLVLCNPENRRIGFLRRAALRTGWNIKLAAYEDLLRGEIDVASVARDCTVARIDSPGENFAVERLLLARGAELTSASGYANLDEAAALKLEYQLGQIHFPWQYFLGFKSLLSELDARLPGMRWMNSPPAVATMFDKLAATAHFQACGIATPQQFGVIDSFEQLHEHLRHCPGNRMFVKLTSSSSASGVVAIAAARGQLQATTTVERERTAEGELKLFNSLKLIHLRDLHEIQALIEALIPHRILAEQWLPKAAYDHRSTYDLRVLVVNGRSTHCIPRVSSSPMTNLHLGNRRGDWLSIKAKIGGNLERLTSLCSQAANAIPGTFYTGLDIVCAPTLKQFHLLEANACGDLLPGIVDAQGDDTYTAQLSVLRQVEHGGAS